MKRVRAAQINKALYNNKFNRKVSTYDVDTKLAVILVYTIEQAKENFRFL